MISRLVLVLVLLAAFLTPMVLSSAIPEGVHTLSIVTDVTYECPDDMLLIVDVRTTPSQYCIYGVLPEKSYETADYRFRQ